MELEREHSGGWTNLNQWGRTLKNPIYTLQKNIFSKTNTKGEKSVPGPNKTQYWVVDICSTIKLIFKRVACLPLTLTAYLNIPI
ncbi:hypothetical protein HanIR_Chr01g0038841 [Helianthus annuus]|nr:hypothetical protein HanIR_Chr01g0038841 [Helianthus annuus]